MKNNRYKFLTTKWTFPEEADGCYEEILTEESNLYIEEALTRMIGWIGQHQSHYVDKDGVGILELSTFPKNHKQLSARIEEME